LPLSAEQLWLESVKRWETARADGYRKEKIEYHLKLRRVFWSIGDAHDEALRRLGYKENGRSDDDAN
jgi:hypothetical protein